MENVQRMPTTQVVENKGKTSLLKRGFVGLGSMFAVAASNAAINAADVTEKYTSSGAESTIDAVGIIIIGVAISLTVVGIIIALVKKK